MNNNTAVTEEQCGYQTKVALTVTIGFGMMAAQKA